MTDVPPNTEQGQRRIRAITTAGRQRAEVKARDQQRPWPAKGMPYQGIKPGDWRHEGPFDETGHLPEDCPVFPLGYDGEKRFFVDTAGQIFNSEGKDIGVGRMQLLFMGHEDFLAWAWPAHNKDGKVTGWKAEEIRRDLFAACLVRGPWDMTDQVRGRGTWLDDRGRLVLHCGEMLFVDGEQQATGELGDHFYVRRPKAIVPWGNAVEGNDNPALELFQALRTWNFVRGDVDVLLGLGWIGVAFMGAALDWRPSVFLVGDAGAGKSSLLTMIKNIMGRFMVSTTNATEAGLYQLVGHDALPIGIDELEGEDGQSQAAKIIKMARDAASGSVRIRGGANHEGVQFQARSTFFFSAINPPPLPPASLSRLALLQLRPLADPSAREPQLKALDTIGPRLLRRVMDNWDGFDNLREAYMDVLRENGHDARGQKTFGTLLASGHMLLGDHGMEELGYSFENLGHWGRMLAADAAPEVSNKTPNWARCIDEILISQVDAWNKGERRTVGQFIVDASATEETMLGDVNRHLAVAGLHLLPAGRAWDGAGLVLAVPQSGKDVNRLFMGSSWGGDGNTGSWQFALDQAPEQIVRKQILAKSGRGDAGATTNRISIGGVQRRCQFVSLKDLKEWQGG